MLAFFFSFPILQLLWLPLHSLVHQLPGFWLPLSLRVHQYSKDTLIQKRAEIQRKNIAYQNYNRKALFQNNIHTLDFIVYGETVLAGRPHMPCHNHNHNRSGPLNHRKRFMHLALRTPGNTFIGIHRNTWKKPDRMLKVGLQMHYARIYNFIGSAPPERYCNLPIAVPSI